MKRVSAFGAACIVAGASSACASSHEFTNLDRARVQHMLRNVSDDVREHYYDVHFHGVDWDARVAKAEQEIAQASSLNMAMSHVAGALDSLDDSHTFFLAPTRPYRHDYGFLSQMIMTDGKSLERGGVVPDEIVLPAAADLAEGRDPVLARAIETLGDRISPQAAGKMFPFEWPTR
jgi:C-terminal processing protease CtpA/Prc